MRWAGRGARSTSPASSPRPATASAAAIAARRGCSTVMCQASSCASGGRSATPDVPCSTASCGPRSFRPDLPTGSSVSRGVSPISGRTTSRTPTTSTLALALRRGSPFGQRAARPGGGLMTPQRRARLALSILCEPGDPRLPELADLARAGRAGRGDPHRSPSGRAGVARLLDASRAEPRPTPQSGRTPRPRRPDCAGSFRETAAGPKGWTTSTTSSLCTARPALRSGCGSAARATWPS